MGKRSASVAVLTALVAGFLALSAPSASALSSVESCFVSSLNAERASVGRPKLAVAGDLTTNARRHSAEMAADGTIYHNDNLPNEIGGNWTALGENVGMGPTCESIHNAFMDSPGHRANILDRDYNQIGMGVVVKDGTIYVTQVFAGRKSSTTTTVRKTTTTRRTTTASKPASRPAAKPKAVAKPQAAAKPAAAVQHVASPVTVSVLVQLVGMDAPNVDPATGAAIGL